MTAEERRVYNYKYNQRSDVKEKRKVYAKGWIESFSDKVSDRYKTKEYKEYKRLYNKRYIENPENKKKKILSVVKCIKNNPEKYKKIRKKCEEKAKNSLSDRYIIKIIIGQHKIKTSEIPNDLIDLKRKNILLKRKIKEHAKTGTNL